MTVGVKYFIFLFAFANPCTSCIKLFDYPKPDSEVDRKLPGIWNDKRANRKIGACQCGTKIANDPTWILFITLKSDIVLNTQGMLGCVGTIITSNIIATSHNCVYRKSTRHFNIFDSWSINKGSPPRSRSTAPCDSNSQIGRSPCEIIPPKDKNAIELPPFLTIDDLIVSSKPFGEGEKFKVVEIIFQERHILDNILKRTEELKNEQLKASNLGKPLINVRSVENDILLLKLDAEFATNPGLNPICVPEKNDLNFLNQLGEYYGAGMGVYPSPKIVDINAGIVLWRNACRDAVNEYGKDDKTKIQLIDDKNEQISSFCMVWEGSKEAIEQKLGGGPLVLESKSSSASFLAGVMTSLTYDNHVITATFTNMLPAIKYLEYRAHQHNSTWCKFPSTLQLGKKIQTIEDQTYRPWISGDVCGKKGRGGRIKKSMKNGRGLSASEEAKLLPEGPDIKIEFFTKDKQVVESFYAEKVCDCATLPDYRGIPETLKNNEVCVQLFEDNKCDSTLKDPLEIAYSQIVPPEVLAKVKSFRLCYPFKPCYKVNVVLHKITTNEQQILKAMEAATVTRESLVFPGIFYKNGGKTIKSVDYTAKRVKLKHSFEIEVINGITGISTSGIELVHKKVINEDILSPQFDFLQRSMIAAYSKNGTSKFEEELFSTEWESSASTGVELDSCKTINFTTVVSYVRNVELEYEAHVKIFGRSGCTSPIPARLLSSFIPQGLKVTSEGQYEFQAVGKGKFIANFNDKRHTWSEKEDVIQNCCNENDLKYDEGTKDFTIKC